LARLSITPVMSGDLDASDPPVDAILADHGEVTGFVAREWGLEANGGSQPVALNGGSANAEPPRRVRRGGSTRSAKPATAGPADTLQRSLEAEFPENVRLDSVAWLLVYIATQAPTSHGLGLGSEVGPGQTIDVLVQPRAGFELEGDDDRGSLTVPASGESLPLQFKLRGVKEGPGSVRIVAFHKGEPLGIIDLEAAVGSAVAAPRARGATPRAPRKAKPLSAPSPELADLTMYVDQFQSDGKTRYTILLNGVDPALDLNLRTFGPFTLELDPAHFFEEFFKEIDELPLDTPEQQAVADRRLAAKGAYLAETLMPEDLRLKLWEVRHRITSIIVQSEEPWIPWELCKLSGTEGGRVVEGPFLCEAYAITRWLPGSGLKRPLTLKNLAVVVPDDSGLPLSGPERDYLLSLAGPKRHVTPVPATFAQLQDAFAAGVYDGWHFTGHGAARDENPDRSRILLAGGDEFTPESLSGAAKNVGVTRPVVFINACQVGRGGMGLTGIGGWATRFVQAGAGAFVGAYWSVIDESAFLFAKELYTRLLQGTPIGEAVRAARVAVRTPGDPTWLAYTVFADPVATISV
jgi:hypothetical protein